MKNGLLVWNILLTVVAGFLLFVHFSKKNTGTTSGMSSSRDSLSLHKPFRIAYFEMDSVQNNTSLVKDVQTEIEKKEKDFTTQLSQLEYSYQT